MVMFRIGDEVVCVDDNWSVNPSDFPEVTFPVKNQKLTIRAINDYGQVVGLVFEEIKNPLKHNPISIEILGANPEYDFDSRRFRKLDKHTFRNKLTAKLAFKALEEYPEYNPYELIEQEEFQDL